MNALLIGTGSKWGLEFTKTLAKNGYHCYIITGSDINLDNVTSFKIDWNNLSPQKVSEILNTLPSLDLIFFNQNSMGAPGDWCFKNGGNFDEGNINVWTNGNWIDCQLPVYVVKKLEDKITDTTKIGWMVTGFIKNAMNSVDTCWQWAGYGAKKYHSVATARGFAYVNHPGIFFCINPSDGFGEPAKWSEQSNVLLRTINNITKEQSGYSLLLNGDPWW
jgi:hypothetical protein